MLLFRSEEHLERWLAAKGLERGGTMTVDQQRDLAARWYGHRLDEDWRRFTPEEAHAVFEQVGLEGRFWRLT